MLDLDFNLRAHRKMYIKIIKIVDPERNKIVLKERIIDFFSISGFKIIAKLDAEQQRMRAVIKNQQASLLSQPDRKASPQVIVESQETLGTSPLLAQATVPVKLEETRGSESSLSSSDLASENETQKRTSSAAGDEQATGATQQL